MVKSLVLFSKLQLVHSEWSFSRGQILFYLARIQDIHRGYCTFACITKKLCSYIFQGLCWSACYSITLSLEKEIIVLEKSLEKVLNFGSKNLYEPNPDSTYSETWKNHQEHKPNVCRNP